jgi:hypothetical protein
MNKIPKKFNLSEVIGVSTLASHEPSDSHKAVSILQFEVRLILFRPPTHNFLFVAYNVACLISDQ